MTRKDELIDTVRRSFEGDAWHGPVLKDVLADVTAEEARWRPARHVHSIWEITLHIAGWSHECAARLAGNPPGEPAGGDWPALGPDQDEEGWQDAVQQVFNGRDALLAALRKADESTLDSTENTSSDPTGHPVTRAGMILGVAQHNAYHAGQIGLLKKQARCVM